MDLREACERLLRGEVLEEGSEFPWRFDPSNGFQWQDPATGEWTSRQPSADEASRMRVPAPKPRRWGGVWEECAWKDAESAGVWRGIQHRMCVCEEADGEWFAGGTDDPHNLIPVRRVRGAE